MGRAIAGVILGYLAMFVVLFVTFTGAYLAMGTERAFKPGVYDVSMLWVVMSFAVSISAAVLGGVVCAAVAGRRSGPVMVLAILVLVLGLLMAIPTLGAKTDPGPRSGDVPNLEAMTKAQTPAWIALLNPLIGAAGVAAGGKLLAPKGASKA